MRTVAIAIGIAALLYATSAHAATVDLYVLAGQSNAAGRASATELSIALDSTGVTYSSYAGSDAGIFYSHQEMIASGGLLTYDQPLGALRVKPDMGMGPEMSLARDLQAGSANQIALLKFVSGGSAIQSWLPGSPLYSPLVTRLLDQRAELESLGHTVNWKGIFWMQGEADGNATAAALYPAKFDTLISSLRADLGSPDLPVVFGQLKSNLVDTQAFGYSTLNPHTQSINQQLASMAASDATLGITGSNNDLGLRDGIHYTANSYVEVGHRLADAYLLVPEPSSWLLLAMAGVGWVAFWCFRGNVLR